jgi:hypothetical protein
VNFKNTFEKSISDEPVGDIIGLEKLSSSLFCSNDAYKLVIFLSI